MSYGQPCLLRRVVDEEVGVGPIELRPAVVPAGSLNQVTEGSGAQEGHRLIGRPGYASGLPAAQRLVELQAYGEERLAAAGKASADIPELVAKALADADPDAIAQAKLIVAGLRSRAPVPARIGESHPAATAFAQLAAASLDD